MERKTDAVLLPKGGGLQEISVLLVCLHSPQVFCHEHLFLYQEILKLLKKKT